MQNSQLMDSLRKFDSTVVILKQSDEESVFVSFSRFPPFRRAGRSLGRAEARKHSAVAGRAPRLRPNPRQTYFVILSEADRRTQRVQRPLADYAEQGGERQTKCSQESIWGKVTDSSSIFRSPQNDNAVFALNHFLSGTHSSARPGRLRGSHLRCEPAPGARSSLSEREQILRDMLAIIVILSVSEESMMNAASAEAACGLCQARRRETNEVQSNICIVSIQILRRYAPQNDKLLNRS